MAKRSTKPMNRNFLVFLKAFSYCSLFSFLLFSFFLYRLNVLPMVYFLILFFILLLLNAGCVFSIHKFKKPLKIFAFVISVFLCLISCVGSYYCYHTDVFLNHSFRSSKLKYTTNYYVLVSNNSQYGSLNDIDGSMAYLSGAYLIDTALESLNNKKNFELNPYDDVSLMFQDLKEQNIPAVLAEQTSFDLMLEISKDFKKEDYKVLEEFEVTVEVDNNSEVNESGKFNIYIGGNDFTNRLIDFNMIVTVNIQTHKVLMTSIPRDYYIEVFGYNGQKDTLSFMGARGIETNMKSLESFFGIPLQYFIKINTESLVGMVDQVGGINYCSETSYTTTHSMILNDYNDKNGKKLYVKEGCQRLNGIEALTVARERKAFKDGDRQRQKNCQKIIMAIFDQLKSANTLTNYNNILNSLSDLYQTTIPRDVITDFIKETINGADWQIESQSVDGTNGQGNVHMTNLVSYVMNPNMDTVNEAVNKINQVIK